jgi:peptidoglycan/xylan/chitin deacetylase (PgdA/CDA1 family)
MKVSRVHYSYVKFIFCIATLILSIIYSPAIYGEAKTSRNGFINYSFSNTNSSASNEILNSGQDTNLSQEQDGDSDVQKAVIIMFDRGYKSQFTHAKPILDKYGFKGSFFIICSFVQGGSYYKLANNTEIQHKFDNAMSWNEIRQLHKEGHDIGSHGMEHRDLRHLSSEGLEYEISEAKECLSNNDLRPTYFQFPSNRGADNFTILNMVSKYFDFGLAGHSKLMFLGCDGWDYGFKTRSYKYQRNCDPFSINDTHTHTNKYAIKEWSHDRYHSKLNKNNPNLAPHGEEISNLMFNEFIRVVEEQKEYNNPVGKIVAIPIVGYHVINSSSTYDTSVQLFDREMKYLYDNRFKVLTLTDLGYDENENKFYIK